MNPLTFCCLDNGLTVILKETHHNPIVSWWLAYRVGSRNEPTGKTGSSHWVEHMLFKGTERFPAGVLDREIDRVGGQWNAFTGMDYTMYYATLPAEHIALARDAELDRMTNALFHPDDVESERTVIIAERQGDENEPIFWLNEAVRAAAFRVHGYHHEIIGDMADLETMSRDDLYAHYRYHYVPSNAILVAVGDFSAPSLLDTISATYGALPASPPPKLFNRPEPEQWGERRVIVERPGKTAFFKVSYRAPRALDPDWFALELLDSVLTGPSGIADNRTSRLYQALVKTEIAVSVSGALMATYDPYCLSIVLTLRDGRTLEEAEAALWAAIERVRAEGIHAEELARARKQARAAFVYETERITSQAYWLARSAILGDYQWYDTYLSRLDAVTLDDIHEVAAYYLAPQNRTVGWLVPVEPDEPDEEEGDS